MRRHPALVPLSRDHHDVLQLAEGLRKDGSAALRDLLPASLPERARYVQLFAVRHLEPHFTIEEQVLFPAARGRDAGLDAVIEDLHREHAEVAALVKELDCGHDIEGTLDALGRTLVRHVRTEEQQLFELIQRHLRAEELDALTPKIDTPR
jgi:iron-sulfur cluster repair protein YtfE (RIC family)